MTITTSLIQSMAEPLRPGEMILMKTFLAKQEYAVLNYNKHSEFSTSSYERYEFDWEKMRSNLTDGALQFFKNYETGKIAGYMTNPRKSTSPDEPKKKVFMGWTEQDLGSRYWNSDPVEAYNKWMIENTETIKVYDSDTDKYIKQKFCRIHIIDLQMPSSSGVVPNQLFVLYRPTPLPPKIRE